MFRVLLAGMPNLVAEAIELEFDATDADVSIDRANLEGLLDVVRRQGADGVIVSACRRDGQAIADRVWDTTRRCRVLALALDGTSGTLFDLVPRQNALEQLTLRQAVAAIRGRAT